MGPSDQRFDAGWPRRCADRLWVGNHNEGKSLVFNGAAQITNEDQPVDRVLVMLGRVSPPQPLCCSLARYMATSARWTSEVNVVAFRQGYRAIPMLPSMSRFIPFDFEGSLQSLGGSSPAICSAFLTVQSTRRR